MTSTQFDNSMLFSPLPKWKVPWKQSLASYGVLAVIIAILVWIPILHPEILEEPKKDYHAIELVPTPVPVNHTPQRQLPKPLVVAKVEPPPTDALRLPAPQPQPKPRPVVDDTPIPVVKVQTKKLDPLPSTAPIMPKQGVKTNVFSGGSSAPQTVNLPAEKVQTGGFGDPHGIAPSTTQTRAVNIAQAGGFDMPTGPGYGNGTGGAKGTRGVVASTGFGNGVAVQPPSAGPQGKVQSAGFASSDVPAPASVQSRPATQVAKVVPAEIISKPVPNYTEEARNQKIEGEVLLEVVFEASGKLRVLRVVRGLGHGLDDAAVHAAEQIRFKPALKDGQPSDSTAVVHIIFQLA
jgi:TonB family protein